MQEYFLEELRKSFVEAIAAHRFIELKYNRDQSAEITKLKRQWNDVKARFASEKPNINIQNYASSGSSYNWDLETRLQKVECKLETINAQVLEQQKITSKLLIQNSLA